MQKRALEMCCLSRSAQLKSFSAYMINLSLKSSYYTLGRCLDSCVTSSVQDASRVDDKGTQPCGEVGDDSEPWHRVMELLLENLLQKSRDTGDQQRCLMEAVPDVGST